MCTLQKSLARRATQLLSKQLPFAVCVEEATIRAVTSTAISLSLPRANLSSHPQQPGLELYKQHQHFNPHLRLSNTDNRDTLCEYLENN